MWDAVSKISTGVALAAFCVAAGVVIFRRYLRSRERMLTNAPEEERLVLAQALSNSFLIPSLPADPARLKQDQVYKLLLQQIRERSRRFYVTVIAIIVLALLAASVAIVAQFYRTSESPLEARVTMGQGRGNAFEVVKFITQNAGGIIIDENLEKQLKGKKVVLNIPKDVSVQVALDDLFSQLAIQVEYVQQHGTYVVRKKE